MQHHTLIPKNEVCAVQLAGITFMGPRSNGITICDDADRPTGLPNADAKLHGAMEADLDFARQLQAKLDAEEARGGASNRSACLLSVGDMVKLEERGFKQLQTACTGCAATSLCSSIYGVGLLRRHQAGKGAAYIKISESEIANDYPEPAQYEKVHMLQPVLNWFPAS